MEHTVLEWKDCLSALKYLHLILFFLCHVVSYNLFSFKSTLNQHVKDFSARPQDTIFTALVRTKEQGLQYFLCAVQQRRLTHASIIF